MITVGTNSLGYPQIKNFAGLSFNNVQFKKTLDLYKIGCYFYYKTSNRIIPKYLNRFNNYGLANVDLYHFFNTITPVKKPWVVTYETTLPRLDPDFARGYEWLAGKYCKQIIAISQRALIAQQNILQRYPTYANDILNKIVVISPSQKINVNHISQKSHREKLVITFVGSAFYRKGGWEMLKAFSRIKHTKHVQLNIVSRLEKEGYMDGHANESVVSEVKRIIASSDNITHYASMDNHSVMELFRKSDIGILPSYAETYGYSLLEAMSCGCAVIATDMSPFPEFLNEEYSWLARVPKQKVGGVEYPAKDADGSYRSFSDQLVNELESIMNTLLDSRDVVRNKQMNAVEAVIKHHDPADRVEKLKNIYEYSLK